MKNKTIISTADKFKGNPRKISDKQKRLLSEHLTELGDLSGVIYCHNAKAYVGGNQRADVFDGAEIEITERFDTPTIHHTIAHGFIKWQGEKYVYREVAFTPEQFRKACIVANNDGGEFDFDILKMDWDIGELADWGLDLPVDLDIGIADDEPGESKDAETQINKAKDLNEKWQVNRGDLYRIGKHRLLCGDSTLPEDVLRLMGGEKADICITDPPYGIKRDEGFEGFEGFGGFGKPIARKKYDGGWDSDRPDKDSFDLLLTLSDKVLIFGGNFFADLLPQGKHWLVWDKQNTMPTFGDCELVWTNIKRESVKIYRIQYNGLIGKEKERFHTTQKPVKLYSEIISDYTKEDDLIYDGFLGSGTAMVSAERLKRRCYGIEKDENYCAVILERMEETFGLKGTLLVQDGELQRQPLYGKDDKE